MRVNPLSQPLYFGLLAILSALFFKTISDRVLFSKSLNLFYATSC